MKLQQTFIFIIFVILFQSCPTSKQLRSSDQTEIVQNQNSLLWEISGKDLTQPSYIFGTIHLIPQSEYELPDTLATIIYDCSQIAFEINMDELSDESSMMSILLKSVMENGVTLKTLLSEEDYKKIEIKFDDLGLPLYMLERIKPMILSIMLSSNFSESNERMVSYEMRIVEMTKKMSKKMIGLETLDYQMSMFDSIPYNVQAEMLMTSLDEENSNAEFREMLKMYKNQEIEAMSSMTGPNEEYGPYEDLLLKNRNKNWIPLIRNNIEKQQTLFAVGAGHLGGTNGLVSLLRKDGYKLSPITFKMNPITESNGSN